MKHNILAKSLLAVTVTFLSACATQGELDKKIANEPQVQNRADLQAKSDSLIQSSKSLTTEQKTNLLSLRDMTKKQLDDVQKESLKLRAVLIEDVLSDKYSPVEISKIKARMKNNEDKKIAVIFDTVEKANKIIGRDKVDNKNEIFNDFFIFDVQRSAY